MITVERIVLAFSKDDTAEKIRVMLEGSEYTVSAICHSHAEIMRAIADMDRVTVIMGYKLPDAVADDVAEDLRQGQRLVSIIKAEHRDMIASEDVFVITLPVNRQTLLSSLGVLTGETSRAKKVRTPEEEKIIQRAKLYLMEHHQMDEAQAHRFIQKRSMDTGTKFIDMARTILNI